MSTITHEDPSKGHNNRLDLGKVGLDSPSVLLTALLVHVGIEPGDVHVFPAASRPAP